MNHAVHLRFSLTHIHTKNHPFCVYEQNCCESKTCDSHGVKPAEPDPNQILQVDSTDYLLGGSLVMKNGRIDKYLFEGGYCQASSLGSSTDTFASYFYNQDHLGNIREVVDASGAVKQVTNYYPFGTPYFDSSSTKNADMQPYKYNGKELDRMHGLDAYDYGARQYDPILARWDRMDPLCEKYYDVSPYVYCGNNPVKHIDPDGKDYDVYYDGKSFTISATYFTDENSAESAKNAIALWNNLNGRYTMDGLPIKFDFNVNVISSAEIPAGVRTESIIKGKANVTVSGNTYMLADLPDANLNGVTNSGRVVTVDKNRATPLTGAHEIGHTVGLQHSNNGLMTAASSDSKRSGKVSKGEIKNIIKNAVNCKPAKDADGNPAGKGHFLNKTDNPNVKFKFKMEEYTK